MDLSIAVITYNSRRLIADCLTSILDSGLAVPFEIVIVDNRSMDGTVDIVKTMFPAVRVVDNDKNYGLAKAVNQAFSLTSGRFFLLLNPDVTVSPGSIEALLAAMRLDDRVGLCGPRLINRDGSLQYSCRRDYTFTSLLLRRTFLGSIFPNHAAVRDHLLMDWDHSVSREVDWLLGAAMLLRREAFPDGPPMDERFFLYFEDVDLCLRLRKAGWKVIYLASSVMQHDYQRASAGGFLSQAKREHLKSWLKFEWKHRIAKQCIKSSEEPIEYPHAQASK